MNFREYQDKALWTRQTPAIETEDPVVPLLGLAGEIGELASEYKKFLRDGEAHGLYLERIEEEMGDILWYLADAAAFFQLDLEEVAEKNLVKCRERWSNANGEGRSHFDAEFPPEERFPREMEVVFASVVVEGQTKMQMSVNGKPLGSALTDNADEDDGYRFHDVFHLTCVAKLGWSPVIRSLMKRKRKSRDRMDEVEDGGRAVAIEEGVSALAFVYAQEHNLLENVRTVDYNLLRTIKGMTKHLEVSACSLKEWENVLLCAYKVWRELKQRDGGTVHLDLHSREICLRP